VTDLVREGKPLSPSRGRTVYHDQRPVAAAGEAYHDAVAGTRDEVELDVSQLRSNGAYVDRRR
jgi:hypothetical protein